LEKRQVGGTFFMNKNLVEDAAHIAQLLDAYRKSCNQLTERIHALNAQLRKQMSHAAYKELATRRRILREERIDLLHAMQMLQEYCR
jgi:hypothetical protein